MHDGDRGRLSAGIAALLVALLITAGTLFFTFHLGAMLGEKRADAKGYAAEYPADTTKRIKICASKPDTVSAQDCIEEAIKSSHENQRSEADLQAQREMSDWAFWLLIVTICQTPLTVGGLIALIITIRQGREGNEIASDTAKHQLRAYICAVGINCSPLSLEGVNRMRLQIIWKNAGATPAINVGVFGQVFFTKIDDPDFEKIELGGIGPKVMTIAPGMEIFGQEALIDYARINDVFDGKLRCSFIGTAYYRDVFGRNCETRAQFNLRFNRDPDKPLIDENVTEIAWLLDGPHNGIYDE